MMVWEILGIVLLCFAAFQITLFTVGQLRRATYGKKVSELELELLNTELGFARDLRKKKSEMGTGWNGIRKFVVKKKVPESNDICSFYLQPHDKKSLPDFSPGQYLTFKLNIPSENKPLIRCYSLSERPRPDLFRVSIKRVEGGRASNYFHNNIKEGDILDVQAPSGKFYLETAGRHGLVLIGGGIGLTPVLSMINYLAESGTSQEIYFFYGIRNKHEHCFQEHLQNLAHQFPNIHLHVCYSQPSDDCQKDKDYHHQGRVNIALLKEVLPSNNFHFYFCGPGPMMETLDDGLRDWGVPESNIHFETFGPSSVKKTSQSKPGFSSKEAGEPSKTFSITFKRAGKKLLWDDSSTTLLEFAEANDLSIPSGCRAGSCGTCCTAIQEGSVEYLNEPGSDPDPGTCLACIAKPKTNMVIDA